MEIMDKILMWCLNAVAIAVVLGGVAFVVVQLMIAIGGLKSQHDKYLSADTKSGCPKCPVPPLLYSINYCPYCGTKIRAEDKKGNKFCCP